MNAAESSFGTATLAQCERTDALLATATRMIEAAGVGDSPRLDAMLLLAQATERPRSSLFASPERVVAREQRREFEDFVGRRVRGEPIAYIVGSREFFSLPLLVGADVLIPRSETELLVEAALERCAARTAPAILDVGAGSGAIALAIKHQRPDATVTAVDVSEAALAQARVNDGVVFGARAPAVRWVASRWFEALPGEIFDLIVSNPPYVRSADIMGPLTFEPRLALDGGADGLDAYRVLIAQGAGLLAPGGALVVEAGQGQTAWIEALMTAAGLTLPGPPKADLAGVARAVGARKSPR